MIRPLALVLLLFPVLVESAEFLNLPTKALPRLYARKSFPAAKTEAGEEAHQGFLVRELVRQAVLIAGREELGVVVRDGSLDDKIDDKDPHAMEITTLADPKGTVSFEVTLGAKWKSDWKYAQKISFTPVDGLINYVELAEKLENLSRTEIPTALKHAKFEPAQAKPPSRATTSLPDPIRQSLDRWTPLSQVDAVRRLHRLVTSEGESIETMDALAQGYSQLAYLTIQHWSEQPIVFAARALLYSQRMIALDPERSRGLWRRGYVLAMIGHDRGAIETLALAEKKSKDSGDAVPPWASLLAARCRYDSEFILDHMEKTNESGEFLELLLLESFGRGWSVSEPALRLARHFVSHHHAGAYPAYNVLAQSPRRQDVNDATTAAEALLREEVVEKLKGWNDVPALIKRVGSGNNDPLRGIGPALQNVRPGMDLGEPSCRPISQLIANIVMILLHDELAHKRYQAGGTGEIRNRLWQAVNGYAECTTSIMGQLDLDLHVPFIRENYDDLDFPSIRLPQMIQMKVLLGLKKSADDLLRVAVAHADHLSNDCRLICKLTTGEEFQLWAKRWESISPYRPAPRMILSQESIKTDQDRSAWVKEFGRLTETSPFVREYLIANNHLDEAIDLLQQIIPEDEDPNEYLQLADLFWRTKAFGRYETTLLTLLKQERKDNRHRRVRWNLFDFYLDRGKFQDAENCLAGSDEDDWYQTFKRAYMLEAKNSFDEALEIHRSTGEPFGWFLACHRMKPELAEEPREMFEDRWEDWRQKKYTQIPYEKSMVDLIEGRLDDAVKYFKLAWEEKNQAFTGILAAHVMGLHGDAAGRDKMLQEVVGADGASPTTRGRFFELGQIMSKGFDGEIAGWTDEDFIRFADDGPLETKPGIHLQAGLYFEQFGKKDRAKTHYRIAAEKFFHDALSGTIAKCRLRELEKK